MNPRLKRWIRESPLGPFARSVRRAWLRGEARELVLRNERYDRETLAVLDRCLRPASNAVDVGAHEGSILREILKRAPQGEHHAFEPLPELAAGLRRRFPGVHVHEAAVADEPGEREFVHVTNAPAYSGLRERNYDRPDPRLTRIRVAVTTIDTLVPESTRVDFMKIDIEGGEYHALLGAQRTIARGRPTFVFEGSRAAPAYGVDPGKVYDLVCAHEGYRLSLMERWLEGRAPYTRDEFVENWERGFEYYFIASPS